MSEELEWELVEIFECGRFAFPIHDHNSARRIIWYLIIRGILLEEIADAIEDSDTDLELWLHRRGRNFVGEWVIAWINETREEFYMEKERYEARLIEDTTSYSRNVTSDTATITSMTTDDNGDDNGAGIFSSQTDIKQVVGFISDVSDVEIDDDQTDVKEPFNDSPDECTTDEDMIDNKRRASTPKLIIAPSRDKKDKDQSNHQLKSSQDHLDDSNGNSDSGSKNGSVHGSFAGSVHDSFPDDDLYHESSKDSIQNLPGSQHDSLFSSTHGSLHSSQSGDLDNASTHSLHLVIVNSLTDNDQGYSRQMSEDDYQPDVGEIKVETEMLQGGPDAPQPDEQSCNTQHIPMDETDSGKEDGESDAESNFTTPVQTDNTENLNVALTKCNSKAVRISLTRPDSLEGIKLIDESGSDSDLPSLGSDSLLCPLPICPNCTCTLAHYSSINQEYVLEDQSGRHSSAEECPDCSLGSDHESQHDSSTAPASPVDAGHKNLDSLFLPEATIKAIELSVNTMDKGDGPGFIFIMTDCIGKCLPWSSDCHFKVASSRWPDRFLNEYRAHNIEVEMIWQIHVEHHLRAAKEIQSSLQSYCLHTNWFKCPLSTIVETVSMVAKQYREE